MRYPQSIEVVLCSPQTHELSNIEHLFKRVGKTLSLPIVVSSRLANKLAIEINSRRFEVADDWQTIPQWFAEAALINSLEPQSILFMCVQNSARSILAEAIARRLAPWCQINSAGSNPGTVRPETLTVLKEAGFNTESLRSKSVDEFQDSQFDVVITLCAEEVCPVFLGDALRVHWPLIDPAAQKNKLAAFRATRDELVRRLSVLFRTF